MQYFVAESITQKRLEHKKGWMLAGEPPTSSLSRNDELLKF
jgi:hypothetical protein